MLHSSKRTLQRLCECLLLVRFLECRYNSSETRNFTTTTLLFTMRKAFIMQDLTLFNTDAAKVTTRCTRSDAEDIQVFNCELGRIRVIIENGEPLFMASDLCKVLEYKNGKDTINRLFEDGAVKCYPIIDKLGREQNAKFLTESQMYKLIMRSNAKNAEAFQDWVCNEVLPSIRKTGSYHVAQPKFKIPKTYAEALLEAGRLALENEKLITQAKENEPKVKAFNELMQSKDALDFLTFSKVVGIGRTKLFAKLRELDILRADNTPYQKYIDSGYFRVIESSYTQNDTTRIYTKTMILPKGQKYITNKVKGS